MKRISFSDTRINDGFWKIKQDMVKNTTLYAVYDRFCETHRFDALACKWKEGDDNMPHIYWDSDVAKWIEGAAYILTEKRDEKLEQIIDMAISEIVKNADENGYFNSHFLVTDKDKRFMNRNDHELYCAGHLIEAAIAYNNATGKDTLLKLMCKYADYIEKVLKKEQTAGFRTPGHPELELALAKLGKATGEMRYFELAKYFIDEHGTGKDPWLAADFNELYNQDEMPLAKRDTAEGHCVRALYLFCGMADVAEKYSDKELLAACSRVFDDIRQRKAYISGSVGSTRLGEAFSAPYYLPNRTAYAETCAAIAMVMFCGRMQAIEPNSKYADMAERAMYNGVLAGISMHGDEFFYENPLEIDPKSNNVNPSAEIKEVFPITQRVKVFKCSCCPPNLVRFIPSIADYMYSYDNDTFYVHQYINSETECGGIKISQTTDYPKNGNVKIALVSDKKTVAIRIPGWCDSFKINADYEMKNGYAYIKSNGTCEIEVEFDMPPVFVKSDKRVHENGGRVALMRGPILYCAESVDNTEDLRCVLAEVTKPVKVGACDFILPTLEVAAYKEKESGTLYSKIGDDYEAFTLKMVPYYAFANRGECEMLVWLLRKN